MRLKTGEPQLQNKRGRLTTLNVSTRLKTEQLGSKINENNLKIILEVFSK